MSVHERYSCMLNYCIYFCRVDGGDLCEADGDTFCVSDDGKLATACLQMATLPPGFSGASHVATTFIFLAAYLLNAQKLKPFRLSLYYVLRRRALTFAMRTAVS